MLLISKYLLEARKINSKTVTKKLCTGKTQLGEILNKEQQTVTITTSG